MALEPRTEWGTAKQDITSDPDFTRPEGKKLIKVELACGQNKKDGWIGMDKVKTAQTDIVHDLLTFPWPLDDASIYEMNCEHFVEHIPIQLADGSYGLHKFMEEVYRCLMPGGTIRFVAPYYTSIRAWQDPTHTRAISEVTFEYYNKKNSEAMHVDHYGAKCNFEAVSKVYGITPEWEASSDEARQWAMKHYFNVVADIEVVLRKVDM